jgi:hypothetical protein
VSFQEFDEAGMLTAGQSRSPFTALGQPSGRKPAADHRAVNRRAGRKDSAVLLQLDQGDRYGNCEEGRSGQEGRPAKKAPAKKAARPRRPPAKKAAKKPAAKKAAKKPAKKAAAKKAAAKKAAAKKAAKKAAAKPAAKKAGTGQEGCAGQEGRCQEAGRQEARCQEGCAKKPAPAALLPLRPLRPLRRKTTLSPAAAWPFPTGNKP